MRPPLELSPRARHLAETLAVCADGPLRARLLLEGVLALGAARAVALWRRLAVPDAAGGSGWRSMLSRGPVELLPPAAQVEAALDGALDVRLPGGHRVIGAQQGASAALVLGAACEEEDRLDLAEALFSCWAAAEAVQLDVLDAQAAALPGTDLLLEEDSSAGLDHDLRNLLAGIRGTSEVLAEPGAELTPAEQSGFEGVVQRECRRAGELVARIFGDEPWSDDSAERAGGARPVEGAAGAPVAEIVRDVLAAERGRAARSGVRLELFEAQGATSLRATLDDLDLARLVRNLVVNAVEAIARTPGRRRGVVAVTLGPGPSGPDGRPACVRLGVEDDGPGLDPALAPRLFEPGVSGKGPEERGAAPCGLGLATVAGLVAGAGGRLVLGTLPAGGARFELWLPGRSRPA